ncbi:hypothetical protein H2201_002645, partial [Coniosporium apollinis]
MTVGKGKTTRQATAGNQDSYRHLLTQSPTSAPSAGRTGTAQAYGYGFGEGAQYVGSALQAGVLQYQTEFGQEQQRAQQQYPQYGSSLMYSVPPQQQAAPHPSYESVPPYPPRQSAAIETLPTNQFTVPQQYYVPGEGGPTSAPAAGLPTQNVPSQYYTQQSPSGRESLAPVYTGAMTDPAQGSSQGAYAPQTLAAQGSSEYDTAYSAYQTELRRTFEYVRDGRVGEAGRLLVDVSDWLLRNAEQLGLTRDDESMRAERLKLWEEFNNCWLTVLQRQKDMTRDMLSSGQQPHPPQGLLEHDYLEFMGKALVDLCDVMEKHGLVDYQMGVWEEEIVS